MKDLTYCILGNGFVFLMTCVGVAIVFFFRKNKKPVFQTVFLGFAAGVMIAVAVFGLLMPAIENAAKNGSAMSWLPAALGFIGGALFLFFLDKIIPHIHPLMDVKEGINTNMKRSTLLVCAITIHNIPEGIAIGLSFALAAQNPADSTLLSSAIALTLGIGIQSFPEGVAVSLPLRYAGMSSGKAFTIGILSGLVRPISGIAVFAIAGLIEPIMPYSLSFAAGAMMYVVVEELIPEVHYNKHSNIGTIAVLFGFVLMMVLETVLSEV